MKAVELLDTLREDVLKDMSSPPMWSDRRLIQLLNEAYIEFAEKTLIIRDSTSDFTVITLQSGVAQYTYGEEILSVYSAKITGRTNNLERFGNTEMNSEPQPSDTLAWLQIINNAPDTVGEPRAFSTDDSLRTFVVYPTPTDAEDGMTINMRVARLPQEYPDEDNLDVEMEIPRQYVLGLTHGAAATAYTDQDADGGDPVKAKFQKDKFNEYIERAKKGVRRQMFQPLTWGFGRAGFSHS